jgi:hypothetical protein
MLLRSTVFALALLVSLSGSALAADLHGKVVAVTGKDVRITLEGELLPQPGDPVTIGFQIPDGPMVVVGTWRVTSVDGTAVLAAVVDATGAPAVGQLVTIVSTNPVARPSPQTAQSTASGFGDDIPIHFEGQTYRTLYQHQMVEGRGLDLYFYKAEDASGGDRGINYNRFVRDPAENHPGEATWWYCRWVQRDGAWTYVESKVNGVTVGRQPFHPGLHQGSVWKTTSTEAIGDRKGQSFDVEMTMTHDNGVTRMTGGNVYAEGRVVDDRFTFTTYLNDGTRVGEGFCVFSGTVFSGGWTSTNGRAGTWQGRRVP